MKPESDVKRRPLHQRGSRGEQEAHRRHQPDQERGAERQRQQQRKQAAKRSIETGWWSDLGVSPDASMDEIVEAILAK